MSHTTTALQSALQMAASQGCWARGLDGPWACGREDLSSGSSRAWLAGLDPCVAVHCSASQCMLKLQLQMQYQPGHTGHAGEVVRYALGAVDDGHAYMPARQPASQQHPAYRRRRTASAARSLLYAWHAGMICSSSGWASDAAVLGRRKGGRRRLAAHGCAVLHTNKLFSVEFEAVQYSSPHFATRRTLPSSPRPSEQRPVPPRRHVRRRCSVE